MTTRGIRAGVAIVAVLALALGACGGDGDDVTEPSTAASDATGQPGEPAPDPTLAEPTGNGSLFVFETAEIDGMDPWRDWTKSIIRYTIDESGAQMALGSSRAWVTRFWSGSSPGTGRRRSMCTTSPPAM